jgi:hypothetical protein
MKTWHLCLPYSVFFPRIWLNFYPYITGNLLWRPLILSLSMAHTQCTWSIDHWPLSYFKLNQIRIYELVSFILCQFWPAFGLLTSNISYQIWSRIVFESKSFPAYSLLFQAAGGFNTKANSSQLTGKKLVKKYWFFAFHLIITGLEICLKA